MPWTRILETLFNAKVPVYLLNIIRDYFQDWVVFVQTASGMVKKEITCGMPQGVVLGPLLWNITFDDILKREVAPVVCIICYTDDTLVVMAKDDNPVLEWKVYTASEAMTGWIESA